jgi:hypothetical protein
MKLYEPNRELNLNKEVKNLSLKLKATEALLFPNEEITFEILKILKSWTKKEV